jgi:hypothetical protein
MNAKALDVLDAAGGYATTKQLLTVMTRQQLDVRCATSVTNVACVTPLRKILPEFAVALRRR